ncbi:hypothetical protein AVEN_96988-1, partial [Araneus ventricosus]
MLKDEDSHLSNKSFQFTNGPVASRPIGLTNLCSSMMDHACHESRNFSTRTILPE